MYYKELNELIESQMIINFNNDYIVFDKYPKDREKEYNTKISYSHTFITKCIFYIYIYSNVNNDGLVKFKLFDNDGRMLMGKNNYFRFSEINELKIEYFISLSKEYNILIEKINLFDNGIIPTAYLRNKKLDEIF
jgi:hypothetical protein